MSYPNQGASNRQIYDCCNYAQTLQQSVDPLQYNLYFGAGENCSKCIDKKAWFKQDRQVVDIESELRNQTRPLSRCDFLKYNPNCQTSDSCISTFDPNVPRILSPSLCPIVYNNIPVQTSPGYTVPSPNICGNKDGWRRADDINTYRAYQENNQAILGNSDRPEDVFMFLNTCNSQPLYNGSMERVKPYLAGDMVSRPYKADTQTYMPGKASKGPVSYGGVAGARGVPGPSPTEVNMGRNVPVTQNMNMGYGRYPMDSALSNMNQNGNVSNTLNKMIDSSMINRNPGVVDSAVGVATTVGNNIRTMGSDMISQVSGGVSGMLFGSETKNLMNISAESESESDSESVYDSEEEYQRI